MTIDEIDRWSGGERYCDDTTDSDEGEKDKDEVVHQGPDKRQRRGYGSIPFVCVAQLFSLPCMHACLY
ncbi:hypothetical protein L1987_39614 [Smallanthus sonchifolius]|uniref:Uncharacterized protein n=1 Tax=Smallanthus sonchifolius TaxID=185202 RepID=A0ACB9HMA2_9ASTR|nr:hypothetical protein L1987_39614 [Smallanthus sonchifolius]